MSNKEAKAIAKQILEQLLGKYPPGMVVMIGRALKVLLRSSRDLRQLDQDPESLDEICSGCGRPTAKALRSLGGQGAWAKLSPEERSQEMARRRSLGLAKVVNKAGSGETLQRKSKD